MRKSSLLILSVLSIVVSCSKKPVTKPADDFLQLVNVGNGHYVNNKPDKAIGFFQAAVKLFPTDTDARLNLANAYLLANQTDAAVKEAHEALALSPKSAAASYVMGCAYFRTGKFEEAVKALQEAVDIDSGIAVAHFQLGRAHQALGQWEAGAAALQKTCEMQPDHPAAHYALSQCLIRLGKNTEAESELELHRQIVAKLPNVIADPSSYERCQHTEIRIPLREPEQPAATGVKVTFADGGQYKNYHGPVGVIDLKRDGHYSLIAAEGDQGFRLLTNFKPQGELLSKIPGATYTACLVGDLNNDRVDDFILLSDKGTQVFTVSSNAVITEVTATNGLTGASAHTGILADLDFTGKLGLITDAAAYRNQGNLKFEDNTKGAVIGSMPGGITQLIVDDWNSDDLPDLFMTRAGQPSLLYLNKRSSPVSSENSPKDWPAGDIIAVGDLNNDLRTDLVVATPASLAVVINGVTNRISLAFGKFTTTSLTLSDFDNDGWLDIVAAGDTGLRVWRNLGSAGFREVTGELGFDKLVTGKIVSVTPADFDGDGDTDLLVDVDGRGLQLLRNDGGNANRQIKVRLIGKRSNASGLGSRLEVAAGNWRTIRVAGSLPMEIGVGRHEQLDALTVHWYDLRSSDVEVKADPSKVVMSTEIELPAGSCPYLYAWDGTHFRFVTDLLGAAPMGLRVTDNHFIDADTDEIVWVGNESNFQPRDGNYILQITEELREVLYLDDAKLFVVDHPAGTEVHSTNKLRPGKPFPAPELMTLRQRVPLQSATRSDGADVSAALAEIDGNVVSPVRLRVPQLRGLAEPFCVTLDFGPLAIDRPLVLALTGWLRFGGGMANVAASHNPDLPFPFPTLEVETAGGEWQPVDVVVGAPIGKTKTIIVDLAGKLAAGSRRLRLTTAFEIHWDRIALFERADDVATNELRLMPVTVDLHWHGFGEFADTPWFVPLTPIYEKVSRYPNWRITPTGWCTRYGDVKELVAKRDDALVLLNGGDELTLKFPADQLPARPAGVVRDFFLYTSGWDKDADYHVEAGDTVDPLPWHGMDDQIYGKQARPVIDGDVWIKKFNTRWVGPLTAERAK